MEHVSGFRFRKLRRTLLGDADPGARVEAASALGRCDHEQALETLLAVIHDDSPAPVRSAAFDAIAERGDPGALDPLVAELRSLTEWRFRSPGRPAESTRLELAEGVATTIGRLSIGELARVVACGVDRPGSRTRNHAADRITARVLGRMTDAAGLQRLLVEAVERSKPADRVRLVDRLVPPSAIIPADNRWPILFQLWRNADLRETIEQIMTRLDAATAGGALPSMIDALDSPDPRLRAAVLAAIGRASDWKLDDHAPSLAPRLAGLATSDDADLRDAAVCILNRIDGPGSHRALYAALLADSDPQVRRSAARGLASVSDEANVELLSDLFDDPDDSLRLIAVGGLATIGGPAAVPTLLRAVADTGLPDGVRRDAVEALGQADDRRAVDAMLDLLSSDEASHGLRSAAVRALSSLGDEGALNRLMDHMTDPDPEVAAAAIRAVAAFAPPNMDTLLRAKLLDPHRPVRLAAADALEDETSLGPTFALARRLAARPEVTSPISSEVDVSVIARLLESDLGWESKAELAMRLREAGLARDDERLDQVCQAVDTAANLPPRITQEVEAGDRDMYVVDYDWNEDERTAARRMQRKLADALG